MIDINMISYFDYCEYWYIFDRYIEVKFIMIINVYMDRFTDPYPHDDLNIIGSVDDKFNTSILLIYHHHFYFQKFNYKSYQFIKI